MREIANFHVTGVYEQLRTTQRFHDSGASGDTFVAAMLSFTGYVAIERPPSAPAGEPQFVKGMRHATSLAAVKDDLTLWEPHFAQQIDGMVLIGDMVRNRVRLKRDAVVDILAEAGATILHEQEGSAIKDKNDNGIKHFGYVDGRSQPLLLAEDIALRDRGDSQAEVARDLGRAGKHEPHVRLPRLRQDAWWRILLRPEPRLPEVPLALRIGCGPRAVMPRVACSSSAQLMRQA